MAGSKQTANGDDATATVSDLKALCYAMSTAHEFHLNTKALGPVLGIQHLTNVGRKIRTIIEPLGFELKEGKIVAKDGSGTPGANGDSTAGPSTPSAGSAKGKKAGGPKTPKTPKTPGQRANKKRKIEEESADQEEAENEKVKDEDAMTKKEDAKAED